MSQTNTNTNNGPNWNQISGKDGQGQGPSGRSHGNRRNDCRNNLIANKYASEGKKKDNPISKLIITETGHRPTQYKKVIDTLTVLCVDKNYQGFDDFIWNGIHLVEAYFTLPYPDTDLWSTTHHVEIRTVNPANFAAVDGSRPSTIAMAQKSHFFDANLQKELLSEFEQNSKTKSQEFSKFVADKTALITIKFGQCDEEKKKEIALRANYDADRQAGRLIEFLDRLRTICFRSDDDGLSYRPYKQVVAMKLMNNYNINKPHDPHGFFWGERGDELNKAMLYLMDSVNKNTKKNLNLAYSQGDMTAYPPIIKGMARYISTQYPNNKPAHQRDGKKGD